MPRKVGEFTHIDSPDGTDHFFVRFSLDPKTVATIFAIRHQLASLTPPYPLAPTPPPPSKASSNS